MVNKSQALRDAVAGGIAARIIEALRLYQNPQTMVAQFYKIKSQLTNNVREIVFNELIKPHLTIRKQQAQNRVVKEIDISYEQIKPIFEHKDDSVLNKLLYQLVNTGRRLNEMIVESEVKFDNEGRALLKLSKEKKIYPVVLLDGDSNRLRSDLQEFKNTLNLSSISTQTRRLLKKYDVPLTTHDLRGVYVTLMHKFKNPNRKTISQVANELLGHNSMSSDKFYTKIIYTGQNPFEPDNASQYAGMTIKALKDILKAKGIRGYSTLTRANKADFIQKLIDQGLN